MSRRFLSKVPSLFPLFFLLFLLAALVGCESVSKPTITPTPVTQGNQEDDINEAVFRYQFLNHASGFRETVAVYCISFGVFGDDVSPDDEFMERFLGNVPEVVPVSRCTSHVREGVIDRETGVRGIVFRVTGIQWVNDQDADVEGGYFYNGHGASGRVYRVVKMDGGWAIVKDTMLWQSFLPVSRKG